MRNITHLLRNSSRKYWLFNVIYDVIWIGSWWSFCWIWAKISWWWCSMMTMNPVTSSSSPIYHHIYIIFIPYLHHIYHHIYIIFTILSSYLHHIYIIFTPYLYHIFINYIIFLFSELDHLHSFRQIFIKYFSHMNFELRFCVKNNSILGWYIIIYNL